MNRRDLSATMGVGPRLLILLVVALAAFGCQPQDETPGLWLRGDIALEPVDDWGFTRDIEEIFIETRPWYGFPHSTTIWCIELDGELYVGSYGADEKTWEQNIASDSSAELAIAGKLYGVILTPVTSRGSIESLDAAYAQKYDMADVFGSELPSWRYYSVSSSP
jgi:hypothetical protein